MARIVTVQGGGGCGGTLIASKWVLSAAHCFFQENEVSGLFTPLLAKDLTVVLGDHDITDSEESVIAKNINVEYYFNHPQYVRDIIDINDITMVKLAEEIDLNIYTPACLANTGDSFTGRYGWTYGELHIPTSLVKRRVKGGMYAGA